MWQIGVILGRFLLEYIYQELFLYKGGVLIDCIVDIHIKVLFNFICVTNWLERRCQVVSVVMRMSMWYTLHWRVLNTVIVWYRNARLIAVLPHWSAFDVWVLREVVILTQYFSLMIITLSEIMLLRHLQVVEFFITEHVFHLVHCIWVKLLFEVKFLN